MTRTRRVDLSGAQLLMLVPATLALGSAIGGIRVDTVDFRSFFDSALAWRTGMVARDLMHAGPAPNLNPPTLSVLLAPLTYLPFSAAFSLFTALGFISLVASFRAIHRHHPLTDRGWVWMAVVTVGSMPFLMVWVCGQLTWILLYPVTRAWLASTPVRAGLWLSPAIAIKPPLALMAIALPWPVWMVAGLAAASVTAGMVLVTGWQPWIDWISLGRSVNWLGTPMNISIVGTVARLKAFDVAGPTVADLGVAAVALIVAIGVALYLVAIRAQGDRRWILALVWSLLMSPLGWAYYLPLAIGPMVSSWPARDGVVIAALLGISIPVHLLLPVMRWSLAHWLPGFVIASSIYTVAVLLAWIAWSRDVSRRSSAAGS